MPQFSYNDAYLVLLDNTSLAVATLPLVEAAVLTIYGSAEYLVRAFSLSI